MTNVEINTEIARLWNSGMSATEIKHKAFPRLSRNAIIGRASRHGGAKRMAKQTDAMRLGAKKGNRAKKARKALLLGPPKPRVTVALPAFTALPDSEPRVWSERTFGECQFPIDAEDELFSCCLPVIHGKNYCLGHYKIMFVPIPLRVRTKI